MTKTERVYEELRKHMPDDVAREAAPKLVKLWSDLRQEKKAKVAI